MNVLIIEDEPLAAGRLQRLLLEIDPSMGMAGMLRSVSESVAWLQQHEAPDLIFLDIELSDGSCFRIFEQTEVLCPVVFTTSYDQFALKAFEVNSLDYLLKPIKKSELQDSMAKYRKLQQQYSKTRQPFDAAGLQLRRAAPLVSKERFLVKVGQRYLPVEAEQIAYFFVEGRLCYLVTWKGDKYVVDHTLEELEGMTDPAFFFQASRAFLVHKKSVAHLHRALHGKLRVTLTPPSKRELVVSKEKAKEFKAWLAR